MKFLLKKIDRLLLEKKLQKNTINPRYYRLITFHEYSAKKKLKRDEKRSNLTNKTIPIQY